MGLWANSALFETEGILYKYILCILWCNHVTYILDSYIQYRRRLNAQYMNIGFQNAMNMCQNQGNTDLVEL